MDARTATTKGTPNSPSRVLREHVRLARRLETLRQVLREVPERDDADHLLPGDDGQVSKAASEHQTQRVQHTETAAMIPASGLEMSRQAS